MIHGKKRLFPSDSNLAVLKKPFNVCHLLNSSSNLKMNNMKLKRGRNALFSAWAGIACCALSCLYSCNDGYDLMYKDAGFIGNSIYDYLESSGNYTNMVKIIDDLGYTDVLARTGSKTLFVADDDAFNRFYAKNDWGVSSYGELSTAQKKQLLYGSMINNACQVAYLSSAAGPIKGDCMRRLTSMSVYDTVPVMTPADMPDNPYWAYYKKAGKTFPCLHDMSTVPMIHFIEDFLQNRLITNDDCNFLFNYKTDRQAGDANVNGVMIEEQNIRCSNGFVHKMAEVMTPLQNMAQVVNNNGKTELFASFLERFSAPYYSEEATKEYNRLYNTSYDSVFQKRYFSERSQGGTALNLTPKEEPVEATLKFDPGWNEYYSQMNASTATNVALQENMGVMLVPTDEALRKYWEEGAGRVLKDYYGTWDKVPNKVISKMLNVNMLNSFINSVPSKFSTVLNDANDVLGITVEDVDSVILACNGAIYLTNKVFNPVSYVSVSFPALVNETMNIMYWAIQQLQYDIYLNSQNSYYSFFIPTNNSLLTYIDPCSYGKPNLQAYKFHYDETAQNENEKVYATIHVVNEDGSIQEEPIDSIYGDGGVNIITNRLKDILENHIVIGDVESGNTYYKTKSGGTIKVENAGKDNMRVAGSWQESQGEMVNIAKIYDQSAATNGVGNGKAYILESSPLQTTRKSVADVLSEHEEFSAFYELLKGSPYLVDVYEIGDEEHACPSPSLSLFNTFNYTIYVPVNDSIEILHAEGKLPTWDDVELEPDEEVRDSLSEVINQFVKYHIQDNSLYIGQGTISSTQYETAAYTLDEETNTLSYLKLNVEGDNDGLQIIDKAQNVRHVVKKDGLYNLMAREYQYDAADVQLASTLYTSSYAVIHQIDGVLDWEEAE